MKIYKNIPEHKVIDRSAITIGSFDGMHLGHQEVINYLKDSSKNRCESILITFHPTPQDFFLRSKFKGYLSCKSEKIDLIKKLGIDNLCIIDFNNKIKNLSADSFASNQSFRSHASIVARLCVWIP